MNWKPLNLKQIPWFKEVAIKATYNSDGHKIGYVGNFGRIDGKVRIVLAEGGGILLSLLSDIEYIILEEDQEPPNSMDIRVEIASQAMSAIITAQYSKSEEPVPADDDIARWAISHADALISALNRPPADDLQGVKLGQEK